VLARDIHSTGFFNNKAKSLVGAAKKILADYGGQVRGTMEEMLTIPGVSAQDRECRAWPGFCIAAGVVVDTHVQRNARRLDLTKNADPVQIERDLVKIIPKEKNGSRSAPVDSTTGVRCASRATHAALSASSSRSVTHPTKRF